MIEVERRKLVRKDEQLFLLEVILDKITPGNNQVVADLLKNEAFLLTIKYMNLPTIYLREDILDRNICYKECTTKWMDGNQAAFYINAKIDGLVRRKLRNKEEIGEEEDDSLLYLSYEGKTRTSCLFQATTADVINSIKYERLKFELYREKLVEDKATNAELPELFGTTEISLDSKFLEMVKLCDIGKTRLPVVAELHANKVIRSPRTVNSIILTFTVKLTAFGKTNFCIPDNANKTS